MKLNQIRSLTKYLDLKYQKLFKSLDEDKPIHDFDVHKETRLRDTEEAKEGDDHESDQADKKVKDNEGEDDDDEDDDEVEAKVKQEAEV